jgi:hypothetical protein
MAPARIPNLPRASHSVPHNHQLVTIRLRATNMPRPDRGRRGSLDRYRIHRMDVQHRKEGPRHTQHLRETNKPNKPERKGLHLQRRTQPRRRRLGAQLHRQRRPETSPPLPPRLQATGMGRRLAEARRPDPRLLNPAHRQAHPVPIRAQAARQEARLDRACPVPRGRRARRLHQEPRVLGRQPGQR